MLMNIYIYISYFSRYNCLNKFFILNFKLLDFLLQVYKKKPVIGKGTQKEVKIAEVLRLSKLQLSDNGIRLALSEELFKLCLECSVTLKLHPAFAEIIIPLEGRIKVFLCVLFYILLNAILEFYKKLSKLRSC